MNKGFSILEIMIAMIITITSVTAILLTTFGNQNFLLGAETNTTALNRALQLQEFDKAQARIDFQLVNPKIYSESNDYYKVSTTIEQYPPLPSPKDYFSKLVINHVSWIDDSKIVRSVELPTLLSNFENAVGGNTCDSYLSGDWTQPQIESKIDFTNSITPASKYILTDLDVYKNILYVTAGKTTNNTDPTLFVFNVSDPSNPKLLGYADNAPSVTLGLNAIHVSEDPTTDRIYAYTASNSASNYSSCNPIQDPACGQIDIFDVTSSIPLKTANLKIKSSPTISGQTTGQSVFFKNGLVFLGLEKTNGPEFHIIDAHNPSNIVSGQYPSLGSFEVGHGINTIFTRNSYAYLAVVNDVSTDQELKILDISDLTNPYSGPLNSPYGFNSKTGGGNGKSIYLVGNKLYLGKTSGASFDFHILDDTTPANNLSPLGGVDIGSGNSVDGVIIRDYLSFLLTNKDLRIFNISDPSNITLVGSLTLPGTYNSSYSEPSMDCEGNRIFISSNNENGQGSIYILKPKT